MWWDPLKHKRFLFWWNSIYFYFCHFCSWCHVQGKLFSSLRSQRFIHWCFSKGFIILALIFWSFDFFKFNFHVTHNGRGSSSFFCMLLSSCWTLWEDCSFPTELSWHLCWKSIGHKCKGLYLDPWFNSIDPSVYPHASLNYCSFVVLINVLNIYFHNLLCSKKEFEATLIQCVEKDKDSYGN